MTGDSGHGTETGGMDIREHVKTWQLFISLVKWIVVLNIILMVFLFFFRTHN